MDLSLKCPFVAQVCGPTQSGKSEFVGRLIREHSDLIEYPLSRVEWYSPHGNLPKSLDRYKKIPIIVKTHLPWEEINEPSYEDDWLNESDGERGEEKVVVVPKKKFKKSHYLIVIDDYAQESKNSKELTDYFTRGSHHKNFSIIQLTQNVFWKCADARTRTLNVHYLVLMRQSRDIQQIRLLSRQIAHAPGDSAAFMDAYKDAIQQRPYSYLIVSFHPRDSRALMLRSNVFDGEKPENVIYTLPSEKRNYRILIKEGKGIKESKYNDNPYEDADAQETLSDDDSSLN